MTYSFADRVQKLQPSAIREILKFTSVPGVISFAAGNPAPEAFPAKEVAEISAGLLDSHPIDALQYSITEGYLPLRNTLKAYMKNKHRVGSDFDELIITAGAQQVMDLSTKALCNAGDTILCEAPTFIGSLNAFRSYDVNLRGIPMEDDGIDLAALEDALKAEKNIRFLYVIPNFQNPSGITMSLEKRRAVYALAKQYGILILEDNPYGELRFEGEDIPTIKSMDTDGIVIYAGSFSKVLSPGMRVGYAIAPKDIVSKLTVCKQVADVHTNIWSQIVADEFMNRYDFEAHLAHIREIYRKKCGIMTGLLDELLAPEITYHPAEGGLFLWCTLPGRVDMPAFCKTAVENNVAVVPGNAFLVDENEPCSSFRLNFSTPTDEQLVRGMEILGRVAKKVL